MKLLGTILIAGCLFGCAGKAPAAREKQAAPAFTAFNLVSPEEFEQAKRKLYLLQPGMSVEEVFERLGLGTYYGKLGGVGSGDPQALSHRSFWARTGHAFAMDIDHNTNKTGVVVRVRLDDEFWEAQDAHK